MHRLKRQISKKRFAVLQIAIDELNGFINDKP